MSANKVVSEQGRKSLELEAKSLITRATSESGNKMCSMDILNRLKEIFQQLCPLATSELSIYLAKMQAYYASENRLFTEPEMDLAVWVSARAYGWINQTKCIMSSEIIKKSYF